MKIIYFLILLHISCLHALAQYIVADFEMNDTICINENMEILNLSPLNQNYKWYKCGNLLFNHNEKYTLNNGNNAFRASYGYTSVNFNNNYYGITLRNAGLMYLFQYSNNYGAIENLEIYPDQRSNFSSPRNIKITKSKNNIIGLVTNSGGSINITRLNFGNSILNDPVHDNIPSMTPFTNSNGLEIIEDNEVFYALIGKNSGNQIAVLNFGDDLLNDPSVSTFTIPDASGITGISLTKYCGSYYGLVTSINNDKLFKLTFNNGLNNVPQIEEVIISDARFIQPARVKWEVENGDFFAFIQLDGSSIVRLFFGNNPNNEFSIDFLEELSENCYAFDIIKTSDDAYRYLTVDYVNATKGLFGLTFDNECIYDPISSTEYIPNDISYSESGNQILKLVVSDSDGNFSSKTDTVFVKDIVTPSLSFESNGNCQGAPVNFSIQTDDISMIDSAKWNFGDLNGSSELLNPSYTYASEDTYFPSIRAYFENGCSNFYTGSLPIYLPPESSFDYPSGILCSNSPIPFTNTTNFFGPDSVLSYNWNFDGIESSQEENPTFNFSSGGIKNVTLTASIPGCIGDSIRLVDITEGPNTQFSFTGACEYEIFEFDNLTTGTDITGYQWDFGDGNFSTEDEPLHLFNSGNTYDVTLEATNALGCQTTFEAPVPVRSKPLASFDNELACSENEIRFFNISAVQNANIDTSNWLISNTEFGFEATSQEMDPEILLADPGIYNITLRAVSNYGCSDTLTSDIEVIESPQVDYTSEIACLGAETQLMAMAIPPQNGNIVSHNWIVDGVLYTEPDIGHVFNTSGNKNIRLTARADNNCEQSVSRELYLPGLPNADFTNSRLCNNEPITFASISSDDPEDPIAFYDWKINGNNLSNAETFQTNLSNAENYEVQMISYTANNCTDTISRTIQVNQAPVALIDADPLNGAPPLEVFFTNNTSFSDDFYWDFSANNDDFSTEEEPLYTYEEIGVERVSFIARNDDDCEDSIGLQINVLPPVLDLSINSVVPVQNEDRIGFVVTIENRGTVVVDQTDLKIRVNNEITLVERISERLIPGSAVNHTFDFDIINVENQPVRIVCFEINAVDTDLSDETPENNSECLDLSSSFFVFNPYPNPVNEVFTLPFIKSQEGSVTIQLISSDGKNTYEQTATGLKEGLNFIDVDVSRYASGNYLINVSDQNGGKNEIFKMIIL
ncbi:MAG TPA: hypothetical protein DDY13_03835 [Cytophagales bacterium]|jgi:PKD repeat protein|nr:hypothetical protein [Cytophagales bacterium]